MTAVGGYSLIPVDGDYRVRVSFGDGPSLEMILQVSHSLSLLTCQPGETAIHMSKQILNEQIFEFVRLVHTPFYPHFQINITRFTRFFQKRGRG